MGGVSASVPVRDSLHVVEATDLYQTDEWWKAVVTYRYEGSDTDETAMYLWHRDDGWSRKNKYVVKTAEAWAADRKVIDSYIRSDPPATETTEFPVSDYYTVGTGETVFQSDGWWKAIVNIVKKGDYETNEVMVYVWQETDGDWRRRQKYTIKRASDWEDEQAAVEDHLSMNSSDIASRPSGTAEPDTPDSDGSRSEDVGRDDEPTSPEIGTEFSTLSNELEAHLSEEFADSDRS